jgi:hypothetical protein
MVALGGLFALLSALAVFLVQSGRLEEQPCFLKILFYAIPLPYVAAQLGWTVAEVGRQPWLVYGVYRTAEGVSRNISAEQVLLSVIGFTLFYGYLGLLDIYLLAKFARKGPEPVPMKTIDPRRHDMEFQVIWFVLWGLLWAVYFMADGFDLGVGMLLPVLGGDDGERRVMLHTVGPVWVGTRSGL